MNKIHYNKLIRDKIPQQILDNDAKFEVYELSEEKFEKELLKKVGEEASGLLNASSKEEIVSELADIMAVIEEIKKLKGINEDELLEAVKNNEEKKGGFEKRLFLVWSSDTDYKTNEIYYPNKKV